MGQMLHMDHSEAVQQMATERYLLNELSPELRDAFEEHLFDCAECALDLTAAEIFVTEAKVQLPGLIEPVTIPIRSEPSRRPTEKKSFFAWVRPFFANPIAAPLFATMLLILGYQNFVTFPALRAEVKQPSIQPWVSLHTGMRSAARVPIQTDPNQGVMLLLDLPQQDLSPSPEYAVYSFELDDSRPNANPAKSIWTQQMPSSEAASHDGTVSLLIPGAGLHQGAYTLSVFGITSGGQRTEIERHILDFQSKLPSQ